MIISMTGFANAESKTGNLVHSIEIKSVNSKFFDLNIKIPKCFSSIENDIRDMVKNLISRGKVVFIINRKYSDNGESAVTINKDTIKYLKKLFQTIKKEAKLKDKIKLEHYLRFTELLPSKEEEEVGEDELKEILSLSEKAVKSLVNMKLVEGKELEKDILERVKLCEKYITLIRDEWKKTSGNEVLRLKEKVKQLLEGKIVDENRIELEIVLLADKVDITEECVRFDSHVKFFRESVKSKEAAGKRLNFIAQEMLREANTIASKSCSAEISQLVVKIKEELEKIKEQLQNIE